MNNSINTVNLNSKFMNMNLKLNDIKFEDLVQVAKSWGVDLPNAGYWTGNSLSQAIQTLCWGGVYTPKDVDIFYPKDKDDFALGQLRFNSYNDLLDSDLDIICTDIQDMFEYVYVLWTKPSDEFVDAFLNRRNVVNYMGVIVDLSTGSLYWNKDYEDFISNRILDVKFCRGSFIQGLVNKAIKKARLEDLEYSSKIKVLIKVLDQTDGNITWNILHLINSKEYEIVDYILTNNIPDYNLHLFCRDVITNRSVKGLDVLDVINPYVNVFLNYRRHSVDWNILVNDIQELLSITSLLTQDLYGYRVNNPNSFLLSILRDELLLLLEDRECLIHLSSLFDSILNNIVNRINERSSYINSGYLLSNVDITSYNPKFKSKAGIRFYGLEVEYVKTIDTKQTSNDDIRTYLEDNRLGKVVRDGSCGYEIVSAPWEYEDLLVYVDLLPLQELIVDDRCGIHVHVSRDIFTPLMLGRLLVFMNDSQNTSYITSKVGRTANRYCQIKDKGNDPNKIELYSDDRYEAINITNLSEDKYTIEFRMFASTTDRNTIKSYLKWLDTMITLSMTSDLSIDLIEAHL